MAEEAVDVTPTDVTPVETPTEAPEVAVETTTETPSSEVEKTTETTEVKESTEEVTDEAEVKTETEDAKVEETEELKPKSVNRFQRLANENRNLKVQLKELEELKVPTEEDYLESGQDELTASINAMKAEREQEKAVDQIVYLNQSVDSDIEKVMADYPALNPANKDNPDPTKRFNEKLAQSLMGQYDTDTGAQYVDQNGQKIMVSTTQLPYDYIKEKMDLIGMASAQAQIVAQKNVESMVAHADTPSSSAPQPADTKNESIEQMRERLATVKF